MCHTSLKIFMIITAIATVLGCASLPTGFERPVSHALSDTQDTTLQAWGIIPPEKEICWAWGSTGAGLQRTPWDRV